MKGRVLVLPGAFKSIGLASVKFASIYVSDHNVSPTLFSSGYPTADIVLCYGVLKGTMQWIWGFAGDRYGRRFQTRLLRNLHTLMLTLLYFSLSDSLLTLFLLCCVLCGLLWG